MRSLFLKIFLWFWATAILTGFALILSFVLQPGGVPARWHFALSEAARIYGSAAVGEMERGGPAAVGDYLGGLSRNAHTQACLFDQNGTELAGDRCREFESLIKHAIASSTHSAFDIRYGLVRVASQVSGKNGTVYIFATELPAGPRAAIGPDPLGLILHWGVAIVVSGVICYVLARYLTRPIVQLQSASRQLADGRLETRAAASQGRNDELGDLVRDFNTMADRIQALVSSQRQLISDVSHELRSPLARLIVAMDLARERKGNDPAFDRMEKDFERLNEMVGRLLTVARLDAAGASVEMKYLNLSKLVADVVSDAEFAARERQRSVLFWGEHEIYVKGNGDLLRSAIENIVLNAVRFTAPGTVVDVRLQRDNAADSVLLRVRDHGPGIPESELGNIFRPFYRVANARDEQSGGVGLGLAITDRVVTLHGGKASAMNVAGGGLELSLRIPIAKDSQDERRDNTPASSARNSGQGK